MSGTKKPKITIKPFRHQPQMDPNYAQTTWKLLRNAIHEIHKQNASGLSFEELYRNAYNMVLHKYGDLLYKGITQVVDEHLREVAEKVASVHDEGFLGALNQAWSDHKISMLMVRDIVMYADRVYVTHNNLLCVYDLGLQLFRDDVARAPKIKTRLLSMLLGAVHRERTGEVINRTLVKNILQMLVDLGINSRQVYEDDFERPFLETSADFYRIESMEFISSNSCPDYCRKVEARLKEENTRVQHYMDGQTESKIRDVVERELISMHMKTLVEMEHSGLVTMLRDDKAEDLHRMYLLFGRVSNGLALMRDVMSAYLREVGKALVMDEERQKNVIDYVQAILDIKDKYDRLLAAAFANDKTFLTAINQSFEVFINLNPKSPEFLSLFIDSQLKAGLKDASDDETEVRLDKVMMIFRFVQEKDTFERYYKQHLAKRLLLGRSVSDDAERNMIAKLKTECGYQFTSKLEGMFNDMRLSQENMEAFKKFTELPANASLLGGIDLNVHVLTTGFWPTQAAAKCNLPTEIVNCCQVFEKFYLSSHNGRRVTFQSNMGTAELKAQFGPKRHELSVSTYQMCILLQFNSTEQLSYKELLNGLQIPPMDLKRSLMSLACGKFKLLNKAGDPKGVAETDQFSFNSAFRSKMYKIKVITVAGPERKEEVADTRAKIDDERKHQVEAAIVRIMKSRKTMDHNLLVAEVSKQLQSRFVPQPAIIKKRIESLIERDYLERSKTSRTTYNYLA